MKDSSKLWIQGSRPKTLPAAVAPVLVGTACAKLADSQLATWSNSLLALVVSLALQVGVNFANDYSDGVRGTDKNRVGPLRLVGSGAKSPQLVKRAVFISFGIAAIFGFILAILVSLWLLLVGVLCFLAGWFYTGGKTPYGYLGLGEVFVFIFFGIVATMGTTYVTIQKLTLMSFLGSVVVGCLACALLAVNNLRDINGDAASNKRTLAVRLGAKLAGRFYVFLNLVAALATVFAAFFKPTALLGLIGFLAVIKPIRKVARGATGSELIEVLATTGRVQIFVALTLSFGLII